MIMMIHLILNKFMINLNKIGLHTKTYKKKFLIQIKILHIIKVFLNKLVKSNKIRIKKSKKLKIKKFFKLIVRNLQINYYKI